MNDCKIEVWVEGQLFGVVAYVGAQVRVSRQLSLYATFEEGDVANFIIRQLKPNYPRTYTFKTVGV